MGVIRTLIVDDEPLARERLRSLLGEEEDIEVAGECGDGREAVAAITSLDPDLVFLDIQMPELDGFGVVAEVGVERMPSVVFVTAYDQYALKAFEVHALDYLLKPFNRERFRKALARVRAQLARGRRDDVQERLMALLDGLRPETKYLQRLLVKAAGRVFFVRTDEIDWIEAEGNYLRVHAGREKHLLRETMSRMAERLDPEKFIRIHRSTIVNVERIREMHPLFSGDYAVILHGGTQLTLSRNYRDKLDGLL